MKIAKWLKPPRRLFGAESMILPQGGPLYLRLKRWIEDAVRRGAIKPGDALPSERDLATRADVSRVTVRKAVQHLVREGVLVQRHGSGTYVAPQPNRVEQSLSQLTSFTEDMARRGMVVRSVWLDRGIYAPSPGGDRDARPVVVRARSPASRACASPATCRWPSSAPRYRPACCPIRRRLEHRSTRISKNPATARSAPSSASAR